MTSRTCRTIYSTKHKWYFEEYHNCLSLFGPCWLSIYGPKKNKKIYIFFCVLQKKKRVIQVWTDFSFLNEQALYIHKVQWSHHFSFRLQAKEAYFLHWDSRAVQEMLSTYFSVFSFRIMQMFKNCLWIWVQWKLFASSNFCLKQKFNWFWIISILDLNIIYSLYTETHKSVIKLQWIYRVYFQLSRHSFFPLAIC